MHDMTSLGFCLGDELARILSALLDVVKREPLFASLAVSKRYHARKKLTG